jgi:hypothetical protein
VSTGLEVIDTMSDMGAEIEQIKRETRRAVAAQAQMIAAEEADLARGIPRTGFSTEERIEAMHQLALFSAEQFNLGNVEDATAARDVYEDARYNARAQDMVVMMVFGNPAEALHHENVKATEEGIQEVETILETLPPSQIEAAPAILEEEIITQVAAPPPVKPPLEIPVWLPVAVGVLLFMKYRSRS